MNKKELLQTIVDNVKKKHPWSISQERYLELFGRLPQAFLEERIYYDNLLEKAKQFKLCQLILSEVKIEIKLTLDECIFWEISRWEEASSHNIVMSDIKKLLKTTSN